MPTIPPITEIEDYLLGLVARDRNITLEAVREEGLRSPHDPPWSSEEFVHYQFEIEEHFGLDLDPVEVEEVQRDVARLSVFIQDLLAQRIVQSA
ncbi:MAG TPA: hypothetical protein VMU38_10910 [Candidatus Binatia bacterium]|nr:hypothetical protein [Candidatus Binatia bacterium]